MIKLLGREKTDRTETAKKSNKSDGKEGKFKKEYYTVLVKKNSKFSVPP